MSDVSDNEGKEIFDPEQEIKWNWNAKIDIITGEENEDIIFKERSKLYRWREAEWKERGTGELKILRDRNNNKIRLLLRQDKTKKIVANFLSKFILNPVQEDPLCELKEHMGSDKAFCLMANDFSEGKTVTEIFLFRFSTNKIASNFKQTFQDSKQFMIVVKNGGELTYTPVVNDSYLKINVLDLRKDRSLSFSESGETKSTSSFVCEKK